MEDAKSWSVKNKIAELGKELFGESYMLFDKEVREKFNDRGFLKGYKMFLQGVVSRFEDRMETFGQSACRYIEESGLHAEDFKGGKRSFITVSYTHLKSRSPVRVPMITPALGVKPMEVATDFPLLIAVMDEPVPK